MADVTDENQFLNMARDPYYFKPLYQTYRRILEFLYQRQELDAFATIAGVEFLEFTRHHDIIRQLVSWGFITRKRISDKGEYEIAIFINDFDLNYVITPKVKEFWLCNINDLVGLSDAIMLLLRASLLCDTPFLRDWRINDLVMMLNSPQENIYKSLQYLESHGMVEVEQFGSVFLKETAISPRGGTQMHIDNRGATIGTFNTGIVTGNINSNVTLLRQNSKGDIATSFEKLTDGISRSILSPQAKKEALEHIEVLSAEAAQPQEKRKNGIIRAIVPALATILSSASDLATLWTTFKDPILATFGLN